MGDYKALRELLTQPPYVAMDDQAAATAIVAATVTRPRTIPAREIKKLWGRWQVLGMAWVKAENAALPDELRAVCRATYDNLMTDLFADIDPTETEAAKDIDKYLDALVAAGVLTDEQRAATMALAEETVPLADSIGWAILREMDARSAAVTIKTARAA